MTTEQYTAELTVPKAGFEWREGGVVSTTENPHIVGHDNYGDEVMEFVTEPDIYGDSYLAPKGQVDDPAWKFDPFKEHTGMFRDFANLPAPARKPGNRILRVAREKELKEAILAFANKYGGLGLTETVVPDSELPDRDLPHDELLEIAKHWPPENSFAFFGEALDIWVDRIGRMKQAVDLWSRLKKEERLPQKRRNDEIALDRRRLENMVNYDGLGNTGGARLSDEGKHLGFKFRYHAPTSDNALWVQLALAVAGNKQYERCRHCATYFEIGPGAARNSRVYCSETCRAAAYRKRKAE